MVGRIDEFIKYLNLVLGDHMIVKKQTKTKTICWPLYRILSS